MTHPAPTVFVVDDDPDVLKALTRLLRSAKLPVVAFGSPLEFLERYTPGTPGCLVLDISMPGLNGLDLQASLETRGWAIPIIFLTGKGDIPMSVRAMKQGALDFLTKPVRDEVLLAAIRVAFEKDAQDRRADSERQEVEARLASLTPRERDVLALVVAGRLNKQIAADLGTVEQTIKVHRGRVMEKMRAASLADLVRMAARVGIGNAPDQPALN